MTPSKTEERLAYLRTCLATFPDSVVAACYPPDAPPPLAPLKTLLPASGTPQDPVLAKFVRRLRGARPDLSPEGLLELHVPTRAGDQEVYLARLGKWRFEARRLEGSG